MDHPFHHDGENETTHFLLEIAEAANSSLDLDHLLERIAGVVKKAIDYRIFAILLLTERTQELRIRYDIGHPPEAKKLRIKFAEEAAAQDRLHAQRSHSSQCVLALVQRGTHRRAQIAVSLAPPGGTSTGVDWSTDVD